MKRSIAIILIISALIFGSASLFSCGEDTLGEFLKELSDTQQYRMEIKTFGTHGVSTIASVYDGNKILSTGTAGEISYLERADDIYYVYYKNARNDWVKEKYEGSTDRIYLDSVYLDVKSYEEATEEPNTYKFKDGISIDGVTVKEVRASLRDGKFTITVPLDNTSTMQIVIQSVGNTAITLPEVK